MARNMREMLEERTKKSVEDCVLDDVYESMKIVKRADYRNGDEPTYYVRWEDMMQVLTHLSNKYANFNRKNKDN